VIWDSEVLSLLWASKLNERVLNTHVAMESVAVVALKASDLSEGVGVHVVVEGVLAEQFVGIASLALINLAWALGFKSDADVVFFFKEGHWQIPAAIGLINITASSSQNFVSWALTLMSINVVG